MSKIANPILTSYSKSLRKNMTKQERHLWYDFLKFLPFTINRQKVIGKYIVDFYCAEAKIVIELDGSQHYIDDGKEKDTERDAYLNSIGLKVLRYTNFDIDKNFSGVCDEIMRHLNCKSNRV